MAMPCQGDQAQARKGGGLNPQQIPMTSFHQNRGAPWSLTLDFPGTQTSASDFWWRSQKKTTRLQRHNEVVKPKPKTNPND